MIDTFPEIFLSSDPVKIAGLPAISVTSFLLVEILKSVVHFSSPVRLRVVSWNSNPLFTTLPTFCIPESNPEV